MMGTSAKNLAASSGVTLSPDRAADPCSRPVRPADEL